MVRTIDCGGANAKEAAVGHGRREEVSSPGEHPDSEQRVETSMKRQTHLALGTLPLAPSTAAHPAPSALITPGTGLQQPHKAASDLLQTQGPIAAPVACLSPGRAFGSKGLATCWI